MDSVIAQKIADFFGQYGTRTYRKGQILVHAHDNPSHVFHLVKGRVKQYDISYRGDEVVLNIFQEPAFFPMSYAINRTPNIYFFEADTEVVLQSAPLDESVDFLKANPDVMFDLLARLYRGTDGLLGRLAHIMVGGARNRILYELLIQGRRFGVSNGTAVAIPSNESDIGAQAGLARETVNREMNKLKRDGMITVLNGEIRILDMNLLSETIGREL